VISKDNSLVLMLGGRSRNGDWMGEIFNPATHECDMAIARIGCTPEDIANNIVPTISGGVGTTFNEEPVSQGKFQLRPIADDIRGPVQPSPRDLYQYARVLPAVLDIGDEAIGRLRES
jgi:hypothetical protein